MKKKETAGLSVQSEASDCLFSLIFALLSKCWGLSIRRQSGRRRRVWLLKTTHRTWSQPIKRVEQSECEWGSVLPAALGPDKSILHIWSLKNLLGEELRKTSGRRGTVRTAGRRRSE